MFMNCLGRVGRGYIRFVNAQPRLPIVFAALEGRNAQEKRMCRHQASFDQERLAAPTCADGDGTQMERRQSVVDSISEGSISVSFDEFPGGALQRSLELERDLQQYGISFEFLDRSPPAQLLQPAIRACKSFVLPRSSKALEVASRRGRSAIVAREIFRLVVEAQDRVKAWEAMRRENVVSADRFPLTVVLDNIRSSQNVGSMLQICDAACVEEVVLCGITPSPPDPAVLRVAGTTLAARVPVRVAPSAAHVVQSRRDSAHIWSYETTSQADCYQDVCPPRPLVVVFGNELHGVSVDVLNSCDKHVCLPTRGVKNSLNVAVAAGIAIFDIVRQWRIDHTAENIISWHGQGKAMSP